MRYLAIMAVLLAVSCGEGDELPDAITILSPQYQEAYRLLPTDSGEFEGFDLAAWENLEKGGGYDLAPPKLNLAAALPMLQASAGSPEDTQWVADQLRTFAPDLADRFQTGEDVFTLTKVLESVVDAGFDREVTDLIIRFDGIKAGQSEDSIEAAIENSRWLNDHMRALGALGNKERIVREHELTVCSLLMELVVKRDPRNVISQGKCDIERALSLAR